MADSRPAYWRRIRSAVLAREARDCRLCRPAAAAYPPGVDPEIDALMNGIVDAREAAMTAEIPGEIRDALECPAPVPLPPSVLGYLVARSDGRGGASCTTHTSLMGLEQAKREARMYGVLPGGRFFAVEVREVSDDG